MKMERQKLINYCNEVGISLDEVAEKYGLGKTSTDDDLMKALQDFQDTCISYAQ